MARSSARRLPRGPIAALSRRFAHRARPERNRAPTHCGARPAADRSDARHRARGIPCRRASLNRCERGRKRLFPAWHRAGPLAADCLRWRASEFPGARLEAAFEVAVETGDAWTQFAISGSASRDLLAKGCALDLHPSAFREGGCAVTRFAQLRCVLHHVGVGYRLLVGRSHAASLAEWLVEAAAEFGLEVKVPAEAPSREMHPYTHST